MLERLIEVSNDLHAAREALREDYDETRLYNLRVASRRIRSILKHDDAEQARSFRKAWGSFVAVTGNARDWDVFLTCAEEILDAPSFARFREVNQSEIEASRQAVIDMLGSLAWQKHLNAWEAFLQNADDRRADSGGGAALSLALEQANRRLRKAMAKDTDRRWHKFRIAVKEVRYVAEANPDLPEHAVITSACKELQTLLGDWHDTVVQREMLARLPPDPVHSELETLILRRKHHFLTGILDWLSGQSLFSAR